MSIKNFKLLIEELSDELTDEQLKQFPVLLRYRVSFAKSHNQVFDASRLQPTLFNYNKLLGFLRSKADVTTGKAIPSAIALYNKIMGIDVKNFKTTLKILAQLVNKENPQQQFAVDDFLKNLEDEEFVKKYVDQLRERIKELIKDHAEKDKEVEDNYQNAINQIEQKRSETTEKIKLKNLDTVEKKIEDRFEKIKDKLEKSKEEIKSFKDFL